MKNTTELKEIVKNFKSVRGEIERKKLLLRCLRLNARMNIEAKRGNRSCKFTEKEIPQGSKESSILRKLGYKIKRKGFFKKSVIVSW